MIAMTRWLPVEEAFPLVSRISHFDLAVLVDPNTPSRCAADASI